MNNYLTRVALAIGTDREIAASELPCQVQLQRDAAARVIRTENLRRTTIANGSTASFTERFDAHHACGVALIAAYGLAS